MMLNYFGIDKLHGFMMHSVMLAISRISRENYYSFQFSNVGSHVCAVSDLYIYCNVIYGKTEYLAFIINALDCTV